MKCGKSTFGKRAATLMEWRFIDLDELISSEYGPVSAIFAQRGEAYFRQVETSMLEKALLTAENTILSLGGGTVLAPENRTLLKEKALTVWINTSTNLILNGINDSTDRPLISGKSMEEILALFNERVPIYKSCADRIIDVTDEKSVEDVAKEIEAVLKA